MPGSAHVLSRRGFCLCCLSSGAFLASGWLTPREAFAAARNIVDAIRADAAAAPISVHQLRANLSVLEGSGGNIAVLSGTDGHLVVDAGITASRPRITEALTRLDPRPATRLINTHWHFDHADGNAWLRDEGAVIVAHQNTRRHLQAAERVEDWDFNFPPSPAAAVPTEIVGNDATLAQNGMTIALHHYQAAHTDGDISVTFVEADVVHAGDLYWNGSYPFIDYSTGGGIDGVIRAVEAMLQVIGAATIVVPGHGHPVSNRGQLQAYRDMLASVRDTVARLKHGGRDVAETVAARPTAAFDETWGRFVVDPAFFVRLVYQGV